MKNTLLFIALFLGVQLNLTAQPKTKISLKDIMSGNSFIGHQPHDIKWSADGNSIYYSKDTDSTNYHQIYRYDFKVKKNN